MTTTWRKRQIANKETAMFDYDPKHACIDCQQAMTMQAARLHREVFKWQRQYLRANEEIKRLEALLKRREQYQYKLPSLTEPMPSFTMQAITCTTETR